MPESSGFSVQTLLSLMNVPALPNRARHILLVVDGFPEVLGGGERVVLRSAELLAKSGFRVSILTFRIDPGCTALLAGSLPCPVYLLPLSSTYNLEALKAAWLLGRFLQREDVRVVETFFESSDLWAGFVVKTLSSAKLIWSRRDMGILRQRKHQVAYKLFHSLPDRVFAVSDKVRQHTIEVDGVEAERVETLYNGLDLELWDAAAFTESVGRSKDPMVVTVGNIRRVKGLDVLVAAAVIVLAQLPAATFCIAGEVLEPDFFAELSRRLQVSGIEDRFRFLGGVADPRRLLFSSDLFVLPSRSEGFSNAIIEAMAASLPVVATDVGGNSEAVESGVTGIIVRSEDPTALAEAILRFLQDPDLRRAAGAAGRLRVAERFSTAAVGGQLLTTLHRLCD